MNNDNLYNLNGLSQKLNLPVKWLKMKAVEGQIPCLKIGQKFRFNIEAVKQALSELAARRGNHE
jgi:hypothetical protein